MKLFYGSPLKEPENSETSLPFSRRYSIPSNKRHSMKKIIFLERKMDSNLVYFQLIGRENRLALTESTLEYLLKNPACFKLGPADIAELKRGIRAFQIQ